MKNAYTEYLISKGWFEAESMSFRKIGSDIEIFFDTSSQIEIYNKENRRIGTHYLESLDDLIKIVDELVGGSSGG